MVQVIEQSSAGGNLGQSLGQGISTGLQMLMTQKLESIQEQKQLEKQKKQSEQLQKHYESLGLPKGLAALNPAVQKEIMAQGYKEKLMKKIFGGNQLQGMQGADQGMQEGGMQGMQEGGVQGEEGGGYSDSQIQAIGIFDPNLARLMQSQKEAAEKKTEKGETRSFERNKKYIEKLDDERSQLPKKQLALSQMESALESGDFESIRNTLADYTGIEFLKTASAQQANSAIKEYMMSDLASMTGRPNMFVEQQLTKALINPQYSKQANKIILKGLVGTHNLKKRELQVAQELEDEYTEKGKEIPRNFQSIIRKRMQPEIDSYEKQLNRDVKSIFKNEEEAKNSVLMIAPDGKTYQVSKEQAKEAQSAGYKLKK